MALFELVSIFLGLIGLGLGLYLAAVVRASGRRGEGYVSALLAAIGGLRFDVAHADALRNQPGSVKAMLGVHARADEPPFSARPDAPPAGAAPAAPVSPLFERRRRYVVEGPSSTRRDAGEPPPPKSERRSSSPPAPWSRKTAERRGSERGEELASGVLARQGSVHGGPPPGLEPLAFEDLIGYEDLTPPKGSRSPWPPRR